MNILQNPSLGALAPGSQRLLLVNAPAVDVRLPWARWQQPTGLLQIGSALRARGCDVRLIDCLQIPPSGRLARERVGRLSVEGRCLDLWRFGLSPARAAAQMRSWRRDGWHPEQIFVSCAVSTWWQGARDLIARLKDSEFAGIPITLGGAFPTFYPEHARTYTAADIVVAGDVADALVALPDLTLYRPGRLPRFAGVRLFAPGGLLPDMPARRARSAEEVADQVAQLVGLGVTTLAFVDAWLGPDDREALAAALEHIASRSFPRVRFVATGNLSPRLIDDELAVLLRRAGFRQVYLHDDVRHTSDGVQHLTSREEYARCADALHQAGFQRRTDEIGAGVLVGIPGEDLSAMTARLARLASAVGSVNLVPYQYTPATPEGQTYARLLAQRNGHLDPTTLNAHLYPLARLAGASLEDYLELARLAALLNSKYHSQTFDFLGNSLTARLVRASLGEGLWNPFRSTAEAAPSPLAPPVLPAGRKDPP
ncbi:MAG: cobalamin B12-binding domain-containing protein [Chloroflexi bacterium]|nr:cobalamin B12-binding domain-containing protein [Chloroflexota bacterium]